MRRRHRVGTEQVEADLPITPMLDMSFQLLAFFIMTFKSTPTEGQIAMTLPPDNPGGGVGTPDVSADKPVKYIARVTATDNGQIASINIREDGTADDKGVEVSDIGGYFATLKPKGDLAERAAETAKAKGLAAPPPPKLVLEIGDRLLQEYVVSLIDHGIRAKFSDISPVPIDPKKR
jgi:hypothetical protein